jgi:hypothetical protein
MTDYKFVIPEKDIEIIAGLPIIDQLEKYKEMYCSAMTIIYHMLYKEVGDSLKITING